MIHVSVDIVRMFWLLVEPRVVDRCTAVTVIHLHQRTVVCKVIVNHIKEYRNTASVALINERLIVFASTIILIQSEIKVRVISPSVT